jgi:RNA polymerase sigma factor (sigma-70 family)
MTDKYKTLNKICPALIVLYQPFIVRYVKYIMRIRDLPVEWCDDLLGEAQIGFIYAIQRFDPNKGANLGTYGAIWIGALIQRYIDQINGGPASVPRRRDNRLPKIRTFRDSRLDFGPEPEHDQTKNRQDQILYKAGHYANHTELTVSDARAIQNIWYVGSCVLPPREYDVLYKYYSDGETLESISRSIGVSRERVRQICKKSIETIRIQIAKDARIKRRQFKASRRKN